MSDMTFAEGLPAEDEFLTEVNPAEELVTDLSYYFSLALGTHARMITAPMPPRNRKGLYVVSDELDLGKGGPVSVHTVHIQDPVQDVRQACYLEAHVPKSQVNVGPDGIHQVWVPFYIRQVINGVPHAMEMVDLSGAAPIADFDFATPEEKAARAQELVQLIDGGNVGPAG